MSDQLSEEEMRQALFGNAGKSEAKASEAQSVSPVVPKPANTRPRSASRSMSSKLRVTLRVSREFEGKTEVFTHDASTLSSIVAELEAKQAAKKKKFRYIEVVSIKPV
ncbi:hypothetical protein [Pseudomonas syringae]|uniref:hypothetical protein n=1 Tax=Pseudomonas syringae TaxID=317 RepID=UPI000BB6365C|nr:hypothetical protein [Pseudomonas syringae]PBP46185.1 hypothetical protein CCL13_12365 [Pseudomonas syringae]